MDTKYFYIFWIWKEEYLGGLEEIEKFWVNGLVQYSMQSVSLAIQLQFACNTVQQQFTTGPKMSNFVTNTKEAQGKELGRSKQ